MLLKELISNYIKENGLSFRSFAKQCGISSAYLSMINSGNNPSTGKPPVVSYQKLSKIASGMGMTTHKLISMVDDMEIDIDNDDISTVDESKLSSKALAVAKAYDEMSAYGRSMIDCILENENSYIIRKKLPVIETVHDSDMYARYNSMRERQELEPEQRTENKSN